MRKSIRLAAVGVALAVVACNGRVIDLETQRPASALDDGGSTVASGTLSGAALCTIPAPTDVGETSVPEDAGALDTIVGTWTGYLEAFSFQSGSDAVAVAFVAQPDGTIGGTVTFGNEPAPAPPTSGDETFPPNQIGDLSPYEGFPYTAIQVSFDGTRLRLGVVSRELWKTWCGFQTSYDGAPGAPGSCGCLPNWSGQNVNGCTLTNPDTAAQVPVNCAVLNLCNGTESPCDCTAGSCTVNLAHRGGGVGVEAVEPDVVIDVRLASGQFSGSISGLTSSPLNVYLMPSP